HSIAPCSCFFFFSSRRRHTSFSRDWSSDVCSSDLVREAQSAPQEGGGHDPVQLEPRHESRPGRRDPRRHPGLLLAARLPATSAMKNALEQHPAHGQRTELVPVLRWRTHQLTYVSPRTELARYASSPSQAQNFPPKAPPEWTSEPRDAEVKRSISGQTRNNRKQAIVKIS